VTAIKDTAAWKQFLENAAAEGDQIPAARLKVIAAKASAAGVSSR